MVLCEVIGPIADTRLPKNVELALSHLVEYPIKAHVNGFGALLFNGVIGNAAGCAVVSL